MFEDPALSGKVAAVPANKYDVRTFVNERKYEVGKYQYPEDLIGATGAISGTTTRSEYGGNYVIFYINVNNESKMIKNPDYVASVDVDSSERTKKQLAGRNYSQEGVILATTAQNAGIVGLVAGGKLSGGAAAGTAIGGVAIASQSEKNLLNSRNSTFSRPQKRLKSVIALHVPNQLSIRYGAGWADEETFGLQAMIEGASAAGRALVEAGKALANTNGKQAMEGSGKALLEGGKGVSSIVASLALQAPGGGAMSALTGLAPNPMKEQIFKGVDFRTFTMEYQFAPRSEKESENVNEIIKAFKYHMHPEYKDSNNFLFLYPSEFDIEYYHHGQENLNIHRHTSCVLTEMNVNYTPNGNFSTFVGGRPTQINVSLTFKELTILTKELIAEGL